MARATSALARVAGLFCRRFGQTWNAWEGLGAECMPSHEATFFFFQCCNLRLRWSLLVANPFQQIWIRIHIRLVARTQCQKALVVTASGSYLPADWHVSQTQWMHICKSKSNGESYTTLGFSTLFRQAHIHLMLWDSSTFALRLNLVKGTSQFLHWMLVEFFLKHCCENTCIYICIYIYIYLLYATLPRQPWAVQAMSGTLNAKITAIFAPFSHLHRKVYWWKHQHWYVRCMILNSEVGCSCQVKMVQPTLLCMEVCMEVPEKAQVSILDRYLWLNARYVRMKNKGMKQNEQKSCFVIRLV